MMRWTLLPILLFVLCGTAQATQQGLALMSRWKQADLCAKQAQAAFPDFTAASNAKRDASLRDCLAQKGLPPRSSLEPQQQPGR